MVRDRAILTKFLTHRVCVELSATFCQKWFPTIFDGHIKFLRKMQKRIYLGNSARYSHFDEIFDPQGIHSYLQHFAKTHFPATWRSLGGHIDFLHKMQKTNYLGNVAR